MDDVERRLREDARKITAEVDAALGKRIDAALAATVRTAEPQAVRGPSFWWLSALTGAAVAVAAILVLNIRADRVLEPVEPATARTVPQPADEANRLLPLNAESAVLTEPLQEELEHLKSDLQRAREEVEEDLRGSF